MSDPVALAQNARKALSAGLSALQGANAPADTDEVAEPVAQAMSALHAIESSGGARAPECAGEALDAVRRALALLQSKTGTHPQIDQAMEAVAGSLGQVHELNRMAQQMGAAHAAPAPQAPPQVAPAPQAVAQPAPVQPAAQFAPAPQQAP